MKKDLDAAMRQLVTLSEVDRLANEWDRAHTPEDKRRIQREADLPIKMLNPSVLHAGQVLVDAEKLGYIETALH